MNAVTLTAMILIALHFAAEGQAMQVLRWAQQLAYVVFTLPATTQACLVKKVQRRRQLSLKACPCCHKQNIRETDSICHHCKLEISLGFIR